MGKLPEPRRMQVRGEDFLLVAPQVYEQLLASRRQEGARVARMRLLSDKLRDAATLLTALEEAATALPESPERQALLTLLKTQRK